MEKHPVLKKVAWPCAVLADPPKLPRHRSRLGLRMRLGASRTCRCPTPPATPPAPKRRSSGGIREGPRGIVAEGSGHSIGAGMQGGAARAKRTRVAVRHRRLALALRVKFLKMRPRRRTREPSHRIQDHLSSGGVHLCHLSTFSDHLIHQLATPIAVQISNPDSDGGEEGSQQAQLALRLSLVVRVRDEERLLQVDALAKGDAAPDRGLLQRRVGRRRRARHRLLGGHEPRGEGAEASLMLPPQCERASSAVVSPSVRAASASARAALGRGAGKSPLLLSVKSARRGGSSSSRAESGKEQGRLSGVAA